MQGNIIFKVMAVSWKANLFNVNFSFNYSAGGQARASPFIRATCEMNHPPISTAVGDCTARPVIRRFPETSSGYFTITHRYLIIEPNRFFFGVLISINNFRNNGAGAFFDDKKLRHFALYIQRVITEDLDRSGVNMQGDASSAAKKKKTCQLHNWPRGSGSRFGTDRRGCSEDYLKGLFKGKIRKNRRTGNKDEKEAPGTRQKVRAVK